MNIRLVLAALAAMVFASGAAGLTESQVWSKTLGEVTIPDLDCYDGVDPRDECYWQRTADSSNSPTLPCESPVCEIAWNADIAQDRAGAGVVFVRKLFHGTLCEEDHSDRVRRSDGTVASLSATDSSVEVGPGRYCLENSVASAGGETSRATFRGLRWQRD